MSTLAALARQLRDGIPVALAFGREVLWSRTFGGFMGRLLGALSLVAVVHHAGNSGLSDTARTILQYYDNAVGVALGWLDPLLQSLANVVFDIFRLEVTLSPIWRHIFLLLWILFARDAGVAFFDRRPVTGLFRLIIGICVATLVAMIVGSIGSPLPDRLQNFAIGLLPTLGIYGYDLALYAYAAAFQMDVMNAREQTPGRTSKTFMAAGAGRATKRMALGTGVALIVLVSPWVWSMSAPAGGLLAFGCATIANAGYWLWRGARFATEAAVTGENWYRAFKRSEAGRFGMAITSVFVWMTVFVVLNVGMDTLGF